MWRVYFFIGDIVACTLTGAAAAWLTQAVVPADWFMLIGMLIGMVLGVLTGLAGSFLFTPLFGGLEVMLSASLSAMVAGMGAGMGETMARRIDGARNMGGISWSEAVVGGAVAGLACLAFVYLLQVRLRGEVKAGEVT